MIRIRKKTSVYIDPEVWKMFKGVCKKKGLEVEYVLIEASK